MEINEECARKVIYFLLKDDIYDYKRWNSTIKKFDFEKIKNLLNGKRDQNNSNIYNVPKQDIFDKLVQKFENYSKIILKWYEKEDYYEYLKQLWLNYICIEEINDDKIQNKPELITKFLESNKIPYSSWPNKVKEEFMEAVEETTFTYIHEQEFKDEFNKQHSLFDKCYSSLKNLIKSFDEVLQNADKEAKELLKDMEKSILPTIVGSTFSLIVPSLIQNATVCASDKCLEKFLTKQIYNYIPNMADARKIAVDVVRNCSVKCGTIQWGISGASNRALEFGLADNFEGWTNLTNNYYNYDTKSFNLNLDGKETISFLDAIKCFFQSEITCGLIAVASLINLGYSIKQFYDISKITEEISKSKESYKIELENIKKSFQSHLREINLYVKPKELLNRIYDIKNNIEGDKKLLSDLLVKIKKDIGRLKENKESSLKGAVFSGIIGTASGIGAFIATGGVSTIYTLTTIGNLISLVLNAKDSYDCWVLIEELLQIQKDAEKEINIIQKAIDNLNLMAKQKECSLPAFYKECDETFEKQLVYSKKLTLR